MTEAGTALAPVSPRLKALAERYQPQNLTELMTWGKLVVDSGLAPKGMNQAGVVLCVQMGTEIGVTPAQAIQNIAVINGKPSIYGDLGLAVFMRDAAYKTFTERDPVESLAKGEGYCKIEMSDGRVIERRFTKAEAEAAGLWNKEGPWKTYKGRMLMFRARWWAMRDADPGVFKGLSAREETEDYYSVGRTDEGHELMRPREIAPAPTPAPAPATTVEFSTPASAAEPAKSGTWEGFIDKVDTTQGSYVDQKTKKERKYTLHTIHTKDGQKFASFSETEAADAKSCKENGTLARIDWIQGQYGPKVKKLQPLVDSSAPIEQPDEPGSEG